MEKYPGGGYREHYYAEESMEEFAYKDDYHYSGGSILQMKPAKHFNLKPEHGYGHQNSHGHGYGHEYERDNCHNNFKDMNEDHKTYSNIRYEKEQCTDPWNRRHDYAGHGGKHSSAYQHQSNAPFRMGGACVDGGYGGYGGYGGHYGGQGQYHRGYGGEKPFWNHKGIQD